jgi:hypothetical protein
MVHSYEGGPVGKNPNAAAFVCRNPVKNPALTITAGSTMALRWDFGAAHVGDCALFMSYTNLRPWSTGDKFFKIAKCVGAFLKNLSPATK